MNWCWCCVTPCWSVLDFWKINLEKTSLTNWIFSLFRTDFFCLCSLQKSILKLIFASYTGSKNPVRNRIKIQFVELDFSKLIFQKSSTDQQGDCENVAKLVFINSVKRLFRKGYPGLNKICTLNCMWIHFFCLWRFSQKILLELGKKNQGC